MLSDQPSELGDGCLCWRFEVDVHQFVGKVSEKFIQEDDSVVLGGNGTLAMWHAIGSDFFLKTGYLLKIHLVYSPVQPCGSQQCGIMVHNQLVVFGLLDVQFEHV